MQQRVCIDFCFRLGKTSAETYEMLQAAFREPCLSRSKTFDWYSRFKSGRRKVADEVKIAFGTCQKILTEDLRMRL